MTKITTRSPEFTREEVRLALRNHGMPLEGLRYPITPIGMHYLLSISTSPSSTRPRTTFRLRAVSAIH